MPAATDANIGSAHKVSERLPGPMLSHQFAPTHPCAHQTEPYRPYSAESGFSWTQEAAGHFSGLPAHAMDSGSLIELTIQPSQNESSFRPVYKRKWQGDIRKPYWQGR